jgi:hypothetical protein
MGDLNKSFCGKCSLNRSRSRPKTKNVHIPENGFNELIKVSRYALSSLVYIVLNTVYTANTGVQGLQGDTGNNIRDEPWVCVNPHCTCPIIEYPSIKGGKPGSKSVRFKIP